jgi:hypothetical protein
MVGRRTDWNPVYMNKPCRLGVVHVEVAHREELNDARYAYQSLNAS